MEDGITEESFLERPADCVECRKKISIHYVEIANGKKICTGMCDSCPFLTKHLFGEIINEEESDSILGAGVVCGNCGTSLKQLKMGHFLGCAECYEIFNEAIVHELVKGEKIPKRILQKKKNTLFHLGRSPGVALEMNESLKLLALNEALSETLKNENYEQAAKLRDQIKVLKEQEEKKKHG